MADKKQLASVVILDYTNTKIFINTRTFYYSISSKQQAIVFTAVKSVLFLFLPPYFFVPQFTIAEEILPSMPTVSNSPYVVFAL